MSFSGGVGDSGAFLCAPMKIGVKSEHCRRVRGKAEKVRGSAGMRLLLRRIQSDLSLVGYGGYMVAVWRLCGGTKG